MKTLISNIISRIPGVRFWIARWIFWKGEPSIYRFLGVFTSQAEAQAHIPRGFVQSWDEPILTENLHADDKPVVRILAGLMPEVKTLFDFGGSIGFSFYQYRTQIPYPPALRWTICDLPNVNELGRRIAHQRNETQLFFTDNQQDGENADVYLTCGAVQYLDGPFADILAKLKNKPRHMMINRIPLTEHSTFFTLQRTAHAVSPYRIANLDEFVRGLEALGYQLVDQWKIDRYCEIILRPDRQVRNYYGFYFVRT